jgi:two-component system, OmpR family, sensor kinase
VSGRPGRAAAGHGGPVDSDVRAVRRASWRVGWQITAASAIVVVLAVGAAIVFVFDQLQPQELLEKPAPGEAKIYVDAHDMITALVVVGLSAIVLSGVIGWLVARNAVRPIGESLRVQRAFVADASHELRTPLAVLDARLQVLQRELPADDPHAATVEALRTDAHRLIDIVNDLLVAAEMGRSRGTEPVELAPLVRSAAEGLAALAAERRITIETHADPGISAVVPPVGVQRCVVALVDNAMNHSADGDSVAVTLTATRDTATLEVADHGPGIRGIDPSRIFDRFAHSEGAPDGHTGYGIGLALVRDFAVQHGGDVAVRHTSAAGTAIALTLPRSR